MSALRQLSKLSLVVTAAGLQATADLLRRLAGLPPEEVAREAARQGATDAAGEEETERTARRQAERIMRTADRVREEATDQPTGGDPGPDLGRAGREEPASSLDPLPEAPARASAPSTVEPVDAEHIASLGDRPVRQLLGAIPTLPPAQRDALREYESSNQQRKTVLAAIDRAEARSGA